MSGKPWLNTTDIIGLKVNSVQVIAYVGYIKRKHRYRCQCECGIEFVVMRSELAGTGRLRESCGCVNRKRHAARIAEHNSRHGQSHKKVHNCWTGILQRCYNPTVRNFHRYGGRGIRVADEWHNFDKFFQDMGEPPSPKHSIDRIDVNGNYCKENCRWVDQKTQQNNRSNTRYLSAFGRTQTISAWSDEVGIPARLIRQRIDRTGLPVEEALNPHRKRAPRGRNKKRRTFLG